MAADLDLPSLKRTSKPANQNRTLDTRFVGGLLSPAMSWSKETTIFIFLLATLSIAALNGFFDSYRIAFFKAELYDDYARYLIWLLGEPGGALPKSPFVYRIGSVVFAAPFYVSATDSISREGGSEFCRPQPWNTPKPPRHVRRECIRGADVLRRSLSLLPYAA